MGIDKESIRGIFQDKEIFTDDEIKIIKKERNKSGTNSVVLAKLFLLSYDTFYNNLHLLKDFDDYLKKFEKLAEDLRFLIEKYERTEINQYFAEQRIIKRMERESMKELVGLFFLAMEEAY